MPGEAQPAAHSDAVHLRGDGRGGGGEHHVDGVLELEELQPGAIVEKFLTQFTHVGARAKSALALPAQLDGGDGLLVQPALERLIDGFEHLEIECVDSARATQGEVAHAVDDLAANEFRHGS